MKSIGKITQAELAAYIQSKLREAGIDLVLTGGAVVTFYSNNKYVSRDLDLVDLGFTSFQKITEEMKAFPDQKPEPRLRKAIGQHLN